MYHIKGQLSFIIIMRTHSYNRIKYEIIINVAFRTFNYRDFQMQLFSN